MNEIIANVFVNGFENDFVRGFVNGFENENVSGFVNALVIFSRQ